MKMYKVNVNGTMYEITVETCEASEVQQKAPEAKKEAVPVSAPAGGQQVCSPMPGTILAVNVQNGQSVKEGDVLFILEAMKMENEIMAPCSGVVTVATSKGSAVDTGAVLATIA